MNPVSETAFTQMTAYINAQASANGEGGEGGEGNDALREALDHAYTEAEENGVRAPSAVVGSLLATLAAGAGTAGQGAVAVTPAAGVVGLHILRGLPDKATLTCIEPEAALQAGAKEAFRLGGHSPSRARFLTARPLDVMGRLATDAYQLIYADVAPLEMAPLIDNAWPLLTQGGTLIIADSLLDGTLSDPSRRDRETEAARQADAHAAALGVDNAAVVTRLPLDGGLTLITKR
nr:O-methyltransferase [Corynebacterium glaucum]